MALKKPSDLFGISKVSKIVENIENLPEKNLTENPSFSINFLSSLDEAFKNIQIQIQEFHQKQIGECKDDIVNVYDQLSQYKKLVHLSDLRTENKINGLKKELYERLDSHIEDTKKTINELYHDELHEIVRISNELNAVERYISNHSNDIVNLREEIYQEIKNNPVNIKIIEDKISEVTKSYQNLSESLDEGLLNEPIPNGDDPLTNQNFVTLDQLKDHYRLFLNRIQEQLSTVGGGGEVRLKYLDDIVGISTNPSAYDGKFLKYDHSIGKFIFESVPTTGVGTTGTSSGITTIQTIVSISTSPWAYTAAGIHTFAGVGIGTSNPEAYSGFGVLTLDGYDTGTGFGVGGGELIFKSAGETFLDIFAYKSNSSSVEDATFAILSKSLNIIGIPSESVNIALVDNTFVGIGTENPTTNLEVGPVGSSQTSLVVNGNLNVSKSVNATSYYGSGSNLTGIVTGLTAGANITILESPSGNFIITSTASSGVAYTSVVGIVTYSDISGVSTYSHTSGISTYSNLSGIATYSDTSGISTYSNLSGLSTYSNISGISTISEGLTGIPNIEVGIVTSIISIPSQLRTKTVAEKTTLSSNNEVNLSFNGGGGNLAICNSPTADITLNVTGIPTDSSFDNHSISFSVVVSQTGTSRTCTSVNLNGLSKQIKWSGGSLENAILGITTTSGYDIFTFTGINTVGSASTTANYVILGSVAGGFA